MTNILKRANRVLREVATIADAIVDGKITIAEKLKFAGTVFQGNLREFLPDPAETDIPTFDQLSVEDLAVITAGVEIPDDVVELVYNSVRSYYLAVYAIVALKPEQEIKLPKAASSKLLTDVKNVGEKLAEILINIGIKKVEQLAEAKEAELKEALKTAGVAPITLSKVAEIIEHAKEVLQSDD